MLTTSYTAEQRAPYCALVDGIPEGDVGHPTMQEWARLTGDDKKPVLDAVLWRDRIDLLEPLGVRMGTAVTGWAIHNMDHVIQSGPQLLRAWLDLASLPYVTLTLALMTAIDKLEVEDNERLAMLRGEPCYTAPAVGDVLQQLMKRYTRFWENATPGWIGPSCSELRAHAQAQGWRPSMLAQRCSRVLAHGSPLPDYGNIAYPYGLSMLGMVEQFLEGEPQWLQAPMQGNPHGVAIGPHTMQACTPCDAVLVRAILAATPLGQLYTGSLDALPTTGTAREEAQRIATTVQLYLGLGMVSELIELVANEDILNPTPTLGLVLPSLE